MQKRLFQKADKARGIILNSDQDKLNISSLDKTEKFLTRKEVKELLNISYLTLHRHTVRGNINVYCKIGSRLLYREAEILSCRSLFKKILRHNKAKLRKKKAE